jgi:hypothetical protein
MTDKTPHPRAELIAEWVKDTTKPVWMFANGFWIEDEGQLFLEPMYAGHFAIGPKPTQPPARMCVLAGVEFPEPMREAPGYGTDYFLADPTQEIAPSSKWVRDQTDERWLAAGLIQATREGAIAQGRAMLAALKQAVEGAR